MATHSSILAWAIPWTEEPGGLQLMGSQSDTTETLTLSLCKIPRSSKLHIFWNVLMNWKFQEGRHAAQEVLLGRKETLF